MLPPDPATGPANELATAVRSAHDNVMLLWDDLQLGQRAGIQEAIRRKSSRYYLELKGPEVAAFREMARLGWALFNGILSRTKGLPPESAAVLFDKTVTQLLGEALPDVGPVQVKPPKILEPDNTATDPDTGEHFAEP